MVDISDWIRALRGSQDRFAAVVAPLDDDAVTKPSYASEWSIAQVASHLGSQAVIFAKFLDAGTAGTEPPGLEQFQPIWAEWDGKTPQAQVAESVVANEELTARIEGLSDTERAAFRISLFGMDLDLVGLAGMRLGEHAMHVWDIAVALDPTAVIDAESVALLVDALPTMAARVGKPTEDELTVVVETVAPERKFVLTTGAAVTMALSDGGEAAELTLPAEALLRLVYGRMDAEHTPIEANPVLDRLREVFPGF
ncbi:MAG TPA: maleylpyruvate isomerase family mycothiol-dependent enzyme [Pseudonocardiaceae bacterium]|nr:maleylpyruvate isomerase family mycothiol-dependent enzyme [Pseudonocardiaceae bacterium]